MRYRRPPAQTRARAPNAHGSHLGDDQPRPYLHRQHVSLRHCSAPMFSGPVSSNGPCLGISLADRLPSIRSADSPLPLFARLRRYYAVARLPRRRACGTYRSSRSPSGPPTARGRLRGLPVLAHGVSLHAWGLRLRRAAPHLRWRASRCCLPGCLTPSAPCTTRFRSSIPSLQIPLSNASSAALRLPSHGSGPGWFATPSLYDSFIRYSMPVYPGAIQAFQGPPHSAAAEPQKLHDCGML